MNADPNEMDIAARPPRIADWLSGPMRENRPIYWRVALAALFTNLFALASSIFTMVVYDRVLPNDAVERAGHAGTHAWVTLRRYTQTTVFVAFVDAVGIGLGAWRGP